MIASALMGLDNYASTTDDFISSGEGIINDGTSEQ
jgi:hypothetical protein